MEPFSMGLSKEDLVRGVGRNPVGDACSRAVIVPRIPDRLARVRALISMFCRSPLPFYQTPTYAADARVFRSQLSRLVLLNHMIPDVHR